MGEPEEPSTHVADDIDPVIQEIPIYLSKRLEKQLYVFQYPFSPKNPKAERDVRRIYFKPQNHEVKLEVNLDVASSNFDTVRAEYLAHEIDSDTDPKRKDNNKEVVFENEIYDKIILTSTKVVSDTDKYAIGYFNGKEYHITPLEGFLQMRPCLDYLDKTLKRRRGQENDEADVDEEEAGPSGAQAVTVKFARNEAERNARAHEVSYKKLKEKSDAEKWVEYRWQKKNSTASEVIKQKLFAETFDDIGQAKNITPKEYIKVLVPEDQEQAIVKPSLPSHVVSLHALRALPLQEQCRLLLKDAKIIQFKQLLMLLAGGEGLTPETLLKSLPQVAVLVRGNWVVKSDVLYPQNTFSAISGVPADIMCRARDYVLYLFTQNEYVERRKVCSVIRLPTEEVKEIFMGISKLRHNKGWELVLPVDTDFLYRYNDIVQRQSMLWEQRWKQLFKDGNTAPKEKRQRRKSKSVSEDNTTASRTKRESISSDTDSGTEKKSPVVSRKAKES